MSSTTNQLWSIKLKTRGTTPKDIWDAALEYFIWCDANPIKKPELMRNGPKTGDTVYMETPRLYSLSGLCMYTGITPKYLVENSKKEDEIGMICQRIILAIMTQNIEFAAAGVFNPIFIAKLQKIGEEQNLVKQTPVIQITVDGNSPELLTNEQFTKEQFTKELL